MPEMKLTITINPQDEKYCGECNYDLLISGCDFMVIKLLKGREIKDEKKD